MKTGAVAGSATDTTNYTIAGAALPAGSFISCTGVTSTCTLTLGSAPAIGGHTIAVSNVQGTSGNVILPNPTSVGFTCTA